MAEFHQSGQEFLLPDQPAQEIIHHGAPRPLLPTVLLEDRVDEIFYQDIHALLPPLWVPPLPLSRRNIRIDDPRDLSGRGNSAERQKRLRTNAPSLLQKTTCLESIVSPFHPLPSLSFDDLKPSRNQWQITEDLRSKSLGTSWHDCENKNLLLWSLPPQNHRSD